jgi:hypothetical protein
LPTTDHDATVRRGDDVSNRDGKHRERRRGGGRPRIDWGEAYAYFASDATITFVDVAEKFGVSDTAVRKHAKPEKWDERRATLQAKAVARRENGMLPTLAEINAETLRAVQKARGHLLSDGADAPKWSDLAPLAKLEQLILGQATDRVEVARVSALIVAFIPRVGRIVMSDSPIEVRAAEFQGELDWLESELAALDRGEEAA